MGAGLGDVGGGLRDVGGLLMDVVGGGMAEGCRALTGCVVRDVGGG